MGADVQKIIERAFFPSFPPKGLCFHPKSQESGNTHDNIRFLNHRIKDPATDICFYLCLGFIELTTLPVSLVVFMVGEVEKGIFYKGYGGFRGVQGRGIQGCSKPLHTYHY